MSETPEVLNSEIVPALGTAIVVRPSEGTQLAITPQMVADILCPGIPLRDSLRFLLMCREGGLNPFQEVFIDKKANDKGGYDYHFIISKWAYIRLATSHPHYEGHTYEDFPPLVDKYVPPIWGKCVVKRKGQPDNAFTLAYDEAIGRTGPGGAVTKAKGFCTAQPRMYLRLVTVARALREAFPDRLAGIYLQEEFS